VREAHAWGLSSSRCSVCGASKVDYVGSAGTLSCLTPEQQEARDAMQEESMRATFSQVSNAALLVAGAFYDTLAPAMDSMAVTATELSKGLAKIYEEQYWGNDAAGATVRQASLRAVKP